MKYVWELLQSAWGWSGDRPGAGEGWCCGTVIRGSSYHHILAQAWEVPKQKVHNSWKCICVHLLRNTAGLPGKARGVWEARGGDVSLYTLLYLWILNHVTVLSTPKVECKPLHPDSIHRPWHPALRQARAYSQVPASTWSSFHPLSTKRPESSF